MLAVESRNSYEFVENPSLLIAGANRVTSCQGVRQLVSRLHGQFPHSVAPAQVPKLNGCVKPTNDTSRTEFWSTYGELTVAVAALAFARYERLYNNVRLHMLLDWKTPFRAFFLHLGYRRLISHVVD